jgi:phosphomannomutase
MAAFLIIFDLTVEKNLNHLKDLGCWKGLDFGIAFDRTAIASAADGKAEYLGDQLLMILARPVLDAEPGAIIIADVKASQTLFDRIAELGGRPLMWKTGHSLIKSKMKETGAPLAGEMSGHIFFKHRWYGFDDALYAAVRLIEAVSASTQPTEIMDAMPKSVATPNFGSGRRSPQVRYRRRSSRRLSANGARVDATDGVRVSTPDGWWLLRASNTQDVLVARAEAADQVDSTAWSRKSTGNSPAQAWSASKPLTEPQSQRLLVGAGDVVLRNARGIAGICGCEPHNASLQCCPRL